MFVFGLIACNNNGMIVFSHKMYVISVQFSTDVLKAPHGLAFDDTTGLLYIVENGASCITVMDLSTGQVVRTIGRGQGTALDLFDNPYDVALDGHGNLLVADCDNELDYVNNRVVVWSTSNDTPWTQVISFPTQSDLVSLCVDSKGNVIVGGRGFVAMW